MDQYALLAEDYHWLFSDIELQLGTRTPGVRAALSGLPPGSRVLDAACGIGVDALALARRGFHVTAADASPAMLTLARQRLEGCADGRHVQLVCSRWVDLPHRLPVGSFDALICTGNSIAHARSRAQMVEAFEAFAALLVPGGLLVLDSHDWEVICDPTVAHGSEPVDVSRGGVHCTRVCTWQRLDSGSDGAVLQIALTTAGEAQERRHDLVLHPFSRAELRDRLRAAGYVDIGLDVVPGDDRYTALARCCPSAAQ